MFSTRLSNDHRFIAAVGLLWLAVSVAVCFAFRWPEYLDGAWIAKVGISVLVPPGLMLLLIIGLSIWWALFDELPQIIRRWWIGPPWQTLRSVHPFSSKREAADHAALMQRLEHLDTDLEKRLSTYVDRHTGQYWHGRYFEQGFGSGEILTPVTEAEASSKR